MNSGDTNPEFFKVCITILEARHLAWPRMNPLVCVQVDDQKKYTVARQNTDKPYYNEVRYILYSDLLQFIEMA
jgi:hypothetical protein